MTYKDILAGLERYGSNEKDVCFHGIGVRREEIRANVIIAPWWEPASLHGLGLARYISESAFASVKVWNITSPHGEFTYIRTGIGAPVLMDVVLSLGVTQCKNILFVGSVGSLHEDICIGDIVVPQWSICGDGASRYLADSIMDATDVFGQKVYPDKILYNAVMDAASHICKDNRVQCHPGKNFSIDTIVAQFAHIDEILAMGCNVIEMETASAFAAAKLAGIAIAAVFSVSDNTVQNKSLVSGRSEKEKAYRIFTKEQIVPQIILRAFANIP